MERYAETKKFILDKLEKGLSSTLYYHGFHHVIDVLSSAEMLGKMEGVPEREMELLRVAVLFHDAGFTFSPKNHEEQGCKMANEFLPGFGYSKNEIETICGMILATRYPQKPKNHLEEIICDADLDYLGRDDFFEIGRTLFEELKGQGSLNDEDKWNRLQESFLLSHNYFTKSAINLRNAKKLEHLDMIRKVLND